MQYIIFKKQKSQTQQDHWELAWNQFDSKSTKMVDNIPI